MFTTVEITRGRYIAIKQARRERSTYSWGHAYRCQITGSPEAKLCASEAMKCAQIENTQDAWKSAFLCQIKGSAEEARCQKEFWKSN